MTSTFGDRLSPITLVTEFHNGVDIAVPIGTKVKAVCDGTVTCSKHSASYGNYIEYQDSSGEFKILYAHLKKSFVHANQKIHKGQVICLSGATGYVTGPHLHYSIWLNDKLIDPMYFLDAEVRMKNES